MVGATVDEDIEVVNGESQSVETMIQFREYRSNYELNINELKNKKTDAMISKQKKEIEACTRGSEMKERIGRRIMMKKQRLKMRI